MGPEQPSSSASESTKKRHRYERVKERQEQRKRYSAAEALLDLQREDGVVEGSEDLENEDDTFATTENVESPVVCDDDTENDQNLISMMRAELQRLTSENMELKGKLQENILSPESLRNDNNKVKH